MSRPNDSDDLSSSAEEISLVQRRFLVDHSRDVVGLASVTASRSGPRLWHLTLTFFPAGRLPNLTPTHVQILGPGQEPVAGLAVRQVITTADSVVLDLRIEDQELDQRLRGDRSAHQLLLVDVAGVDPFFSSAPVYFAGAAATAASEAAPVKAKELANAPQDVDYLAKDYESFRTLMLDHMTRSAPDWQERNPSDLGVTLIEALAYAGDYLSYFQDAVATEAYLQTARRRVSVRRHGVLLDYRLSEGSNTRVWVYVEVAEADQGPPDQLLWLPQGTQFLTDVGAAPVIPYPSISYDQALRRGTEVFETLYGVALRPSLNHLAIYPWRAADYSLAAGSTRATVEAGELSLKAGDVVLFQQVRGARTGKSDDADLSLCQVVRLIKAPRRVEDPLALELALWELEWHQEDALAFDLPVCRNRLGADALALIRGNLVLADQGQTRTEELAPVPLARPYRPTLDKLGGRHRLVHHEPFFLDLARQRPAATVAVQQDDRVMPALVLFEIDASSWVEQGALVDPRQGRQWEPRSNLLDSGRFARHFVAETENDGKVFLRFGDGHLGQRPAPTTRFAAFYRITDDDDAPIGAGTRGHLVAAGTVSADGTEPLMPPDVEVRVASVSFPLGAMGGTAPETDDHARLFAPQSVWLQERCVTAGDFEQRALQAAEVQDASCRLTWGGSWTVARLRVRRGGGRPADQAFCARLAAGFKTRLIMGYQLVVLPPRWVPLDIALRVRLRSDLQRSLAERRLRQVLGNGEMPSGDPALFHFDHFGFGDDVALDEVVDYALSVPGVLEVDVLRFRRLDVATGEEKQRGLITLAEDEIAELSPEQGQLQIVLEGGR